MKIKNISLVLLLSVFVVITSVVILKRYESETLVEAKWSEKEDTLLAISINGEEVDSFPTTAGYVGKVTCTNGSGVASWNGTKWVFNVTSITKNKTRCNIDFSVPTLREAILNANTISSPSTTPGSKASLSTESLLASASDDYGTSYYFRGAVTNNFVEYANMCWRIVRITGNGAVKLTLYNYNGLTDSNTVPSSTTPCNVTGTNLAFARYSGTTVRSPFNTTDSDNAYVGFMYGTVPSTSYTSAHTNTNKSTVLKNLETWYTNVLAKQSNFSETDLADTIWCNDKNVLKSTSFNPNSMTLGTRYGYSTNNNYYAAEQRLSNSSGKAGGTGPTLTCQNDSNGGKLSKFTVSDTTYGNGVLTYKLGLLTADEIAFAGGAYVTGNSTYYIYGNASSNWWWTLTPAYNYDEAALIVFSGGGLNTDYARITSSNCLIRPAISLTSEMKASGNGTATDPYVIQ
ncbi:MAG: hypothetical protein Q4C44_00425 [bacterium]|nr:hypothetical protein [bacterium]